jgi:hypothetical protein
MLAITDSQLRASGPRPTAYQLRNAASSLSGLLRLQLHRGFTDADLDDAVRAALTGLVQSVA